MLVLPLLFNKLILIKIYTQDKFAHHAFRIEKISIFGNNKVTLLTPYPDVGAKRGLRTARAGGKEWAAARQVARPRTHKPPKHANRAIG